MTFSLKTNLLDHQKKTVEFAVKTKFYGDFSVMGTGKSLSALATICELKKKAVIVAPPYLVNNWINEIQKHTDLVPSRHFLKFDPLADVTVIPYTKLTSSEDVFKNVKVIIADEGHYLKNITAARTMAFHSLFSKYLPDYFGYLSGTPIKNRIPEIYSFLLLLAQGPSDKKITVLYHSFYLFCCRFTNVNQTKFGINYSGMKNVEELRNYINPFSIRHSDSLLGLPDLTESSVVVTHNENNQLQEEWELFLSKGTAINSKAKNEAAIAKATFTANYVGSVIEEGLGPVVVFSDHVTPLNVMELHLSKFRVRKISGEVPSDKRQEYVDMLNNGQLDALLCSIGAASTGFNLTASSLLVFNDPSWVSTDMEQAKKRIHRIGSTKPCRIVNVVGSPTDEHIYKMISSKNKVINKVIKER